MITQSVQNAAMLVHALSKNKKVGLVEFSDKHGLSLHYMEQIGRKLRQSGILGTKRGPGGGYFLAQERVSVADIIKAVDRAKRGADTPLGRAAMKALDGVVVVAAKRKTNAQNEQNA